MIVLDGGFAAAAAAIPVFRGVWPEAQTVVLVPSEPSAELLRFPEAGAAGVILREDSLGHLAETVQRVASGEPVFPAKVVAALVDRVSELGSEQPKRFLEAGLTTREIEVARLLEQGLANKEIARRLQIELPTVKNHVHRILKKLQLSRRGDVARRRIQQFGN